MSGIAEFERFATAPDAPAPWRALARRVAAGEFTWQDVRDGRCCADPDFLAALTATVERLGASQPVRQHAPEPADDHPVLLHDAW